MDWLVIIRINCLIFSLFQLTRCQREANLLCSHSDSYLFYHLPCHWLIVIVNWAVGIMYVLWRLPGKYLPGDYDLNPRVWVFIRPFKGLPFVCVLLHRDKKDAVVGRGTPHRRRRSKDIYWSGSVTGVCKKWRNVNPLCYSRFANKVGYSQIVKFSIDVLYLSA